MNHEESSYWRESSPQGQGSSPEDMLRRQLGSMGSGFSLEREVAARPLLAFGAALAAGFLLGSVGDAVGAPSSRGHSWLRPVDDELDVLKAAALATVASMAEDNIRQMVPGQTGEALSRMIGRGIGARGGQASRGDSAPARFGQGGAGQSQWSGRDARAGAGIGSDTGGGFGGTQSSSAPNNSFSTGAGVGGLGYDSPPAQGGSVSISNTEVQGTSHLDPYYPPGGADKPIAGGETQGTNRERDVNEL